MEIQRDILDVLIQWKDKPVHKPVLLQGVRQIGKSWVMENFGKNYFDNYVKIDFDRQSEAKSAFQNSKDPERVLKELAFYVQEQIVPGKTLLILDEIQESEEALNALKYFAEQMPSLHILAAGSLLGVVVKSRKMTVPVGKVQMMRMYPITFREFLRCSDPQTFQQIDALTQVRHLPEIVMNKLRLEYQRYMICGGMPEAVVTWLESNSVSEVETVLRSILDLYELDFAKYAAPRDIPRIQAVWHSIPAQLAKQNRKFMYKNIKPGARSKDYEDALLWLEEAGMIYRIHNITKPRLPLSAYADNSAFKVYACDTGLLRAMAHLPAEAIQSEVASYTEFKGAMAENMVLQALMPLSDVPYYWSPDSQAEVEFVIQWGTEIIPIEVKAARCISGRSLSVYNDKFRPSYRFRFSMLNMQYNNGLLSAPIPLVEWFPKWLQLLNSNEYTP